MKVGMSGFHVTHINLAHGFRGGERQTALLIRGLAEVDLKQRLICRKTSPLIQYLKDVPNLEVTVVSDRPDARIRSLFQLGKETDLIQAHETLATHVAFLGHKLFGIPYVITRRVDNRVRNNIFNRTLYASAAMCVGVSSVIAEIMRETFGVKAITIHSATFGLSANAEEATVIKRQWKNRFVVGHAGALVDSHKGQSTLLEATKKLQTRIPNLLVVFLGDGVDKEKLQAKARGLPVEFLGFHSNVADYLSNFDVFAFPSNNEGLGSSILDAMNLGIPVVASKVGGIPDLVKDGVSGLLIDRGNSDQLADRIFDLYTNKELGNRLVIEASDVAKSHSAKAMTLQYLALYEKILMNGSDGINKEGQV